MVRFFYVESAVPLLASYWSYRSSFLLVCIAPIASGEPYFCTSSLILRFRSSFWKGPVDTEVIIIMAEHEASSSAKARAEVDKVHSRYLHDLEQPCVHVYRHLSDLLQLIDEFRVFDGRSLVRGWSPKYRRTNLHEAVIANSEDLVRRLLDFMSADSKRDVSRNLMHLEIVEDLSGFTAHEMARVVGNVRILQMIKTAREIIRSGGNTPISSGTSSAVEARSSQPSSNDIEDIEKIGKVLKSHLEQLVFPGNFLKIVSLGDEYGLHASLTTGDPATIECWMRYKSNFNNIGELLKGLISELAGASVLSTFLQLRDSADRCILHYLADFSQIGYADPHGDAVRKEVFTTFMDELESEKLKSHVPEDYMNCEDSVGRTPLHLAVAQGFEEIVERFVKNPNTNLNATFEMLDWKFEVPDRDIHRDISALSLAVAHNHFNIVKSLCNAKTPTEQLDVNWRTATEIRLLGRFEERYFVRWSPLQLAAFKGHVETLEILLKQDEVLDSGLKSHQLKVTSQKTYRVNTAPALHLAALGGKPHAIRALLKSKKIDPKALDVDGNTALHYAVLHPQFVDPSGPWDFVNVSQCFHHYTNEAPTSKNGEAMKTCLEMLLQAGLNMDQANARGEIPKIATKAPKDVQDWWYARLAKELQVAKESLSAATNAVSVVATLVAATSFVGPLQPPLGLSSSTDPENMWVLGYSQVNHIAVDIFLFFDNLSFYLAIASIMMALIPNLPIDNEGDLRGVKSGRRYLRSAVVLLFVSITFLICTFSAASLVIIPGGRWKYKGTMVSTTILGLFVCVIALVLFLKRLWKLIEK